MTRPIIIKRIAMAFWTIETESFFPEEARERKKKLAKRKGIKI